MTETLNIAPNVDAEVLRRIRVRHNLQQLFPAIRQEVVLELPYGLSMVEIPFSRGRIHPQKNE